MLGREHVGDVREARSGARDERDAVSLDRSARDVGSGERLELRAELDANRFGHRGRRADEERVRGLVVLGLREEVRSDEPRVGLVVRDDEDFARAGDRVDRDRAEDEALRARDVEVSGANDLVDARDRLRAVRERGDRLRAARVDDRRDAREVRGGNERVVRVSAVGRVAGAASRG